MPNLGRKYTCYSCHTKFYDLGKPEPKCPKCGADQRDAEDAPVVTSHRSRRVVEEPEVPDLAADSEDAEETPAPALAGDDDEVELPETPEKGEEDGDEDEEY